MYALIWFLSYQTDQVNLYKADTCLKQTKYLAMQVTALDRF